MINVGCGQKIRRMKGLAYKETLVYWLWGSETRKRSGTKQGSTGQISTVERQRSCGRSAPLPFVRANDERQTSA